MEKAYSQFKLVREDKIVNLVISREEKSNAFDEKAWEELHEIMSNLANDPSARVIVIKSDSKNFCAGMDLSTLMEMPSKWEGLGEARKREVIAEFVQKLQSSINSIESCPKPVIASISGACIGAGLSLITACDMIYCDTSAYFSLRETDLGIVADMGALQRMPKLMPPNFVAELAYTARNFSAREALNSGLVNSVLEDRSKLDSAVDEIAHTIASKSPLVIKGIKKSLLYNRDHTVQEGLEHIKMWNSAMLISEDLSEAMMAYVSKRTAKFRD